MASSAPTIIDLKTQFLRTQIQTLSTPLRTPSLETDLRPRHIDDALQKANAQLKKHNKLAYGPQALRHVAEQVDRLYWNAGERGVVGEAEEWGRRGCDYRRDKVIEELPETWSEEAEARAPEKAARYTELQARLKELNERRKEKKEMVERYKALKDLLVPFGEGGDVQGNLVTKKGEVETEMERMKLLMVRVQRAVQGLAEKEGGEDMDIDVEGDEEEKLLAVLGGH